MFEVGKKYRKLGGTYICHATIEDGQIGWMMREGERFPYSHAYEGWTEVLPEPKRWSTWQNVYKSALDGVLRDHGDREYALKMGKDGEKQLAVAVIRRDFEQQDGNNPKCVKVELEQC